MTACPSCGRDPGSHDTCPYCGADLKRRILIRNFGLGSIIVAIAGLIVLWLFATHAPIAYVKISEVQSTFNYAYVQIDGMITRGPSYNPDSQSLTVWVRDDTGELMVSAFRTTAQELIDADKVPAPGDTVSIQGTLRVRDALSSLTIDSAEAVTLVRATANAPARDVGSIGIDDTFGGVSVRGVVRAIGSPFEGLRLITLRDATGAIDVAVSSDTETLLGATPAITVGQSVQVAGVVTLHDTTPQLTLNRGADLSILSDMLSVAAPATIESLSEASAGHWVSVQGTLEKITPFSAGSKLTLSEGGKRVTVLLWQDLWEALNQSQSLADELQPGAQISVQGEVSSYRGQLEIAPEVPQDVVLIAAAPTPQVAAKSIGAITIQDVKSIVMTSGTIEQVDEFSQGVRYTLSDPSGAIILLIWGDVIDQARQHALLQAGSIVSVTGKIDEFNGQLEIVPESIEAVQVIGTASVETVTPTAAAPAAPEPTSTPTPTTTPAAAATPTPTPISKPAASAPPAAINQLTTDNVGQTYLVHGKVVNTASFSAGFKFVLDDGTGKMEMVLWEDNYKFVPNRAGLNLGADVSVVAKISEFQGVLQLEPQSGRDVTILIPGSSAGVPLKPVNTLTKAGLLVAVEGTVTDVKGFSSGTYLYVDDGTGNIQVVLFNNVWSYVPHAASIAAGTRVRVVGVTDFFGKIQIKPQLGYDVTIQ